MRLPFAIQSYRHRSLPISAQRLINVFVEPQPEDAKARLPLLLSPGLRQFANTDKVVSRGNHVMGADLYSVIGDGVYRVGVDGIAALLGTIPNGGPVSLDSNGESLCIVIPETFQGFVVDRTTGSITQITDVDFPGAISVCVIDGYFVFVKPNSTEFFLSAINDPLSFNALDFASAEGSPDNLLTCARVGRDLWLYGEKTIEVWSNVGATDFPFLRVSGGFVSRGTAAPLSVATRLGGAIWLGDDRCVYTAQGITPQRISTYAVDQAIAGYERVDDAEAWVYELEGHAFYCLTFPTAGDTWVCDLTAQATWHERESEGLEIWRARRGVAFAGGVVAGDAFNGKLWLLDPTYGLEGEAQIIRVATGTCFHSEGQKVFLQRLALEFECGNGLVIGQGSDPTVWLTWSNDGGRTWSNDAQGRIGKMGEYRTRLEYRRLGSARERVFRVQWSDPVYTALIAADVEAEPGV
jgi:hypothetical protein